MKALAPLLLALVTSMPGGLAAGAQSTAGCEPDWLPAFGGIPGTSAEIRALTVFDDGQGGGPALYAGGIFSGAGGVAAEKIAKWDGLRWSALGSGIAGVVSGSVEALAVFDDGSGPALYAGGNFKTAGGSPANFIAKWDGASWSPVGTGMTAGYLGVPSVHALTVFDDGSGDALYAAGQFTEAGGVLANRIAKWDGTSWSAVGTGLNGIGFVSGLALTVFDGGNGGGPELFVGGAFTSAGGVATNRIARWDGSSWSSVGFVGGGMNDIVRALGVFDDGAGPALYAGGDFTVAGTVLADRIAKWNGTGWSSLGFLGAGANSTVFSLGVFDDGSGPALYAGGDFTVVGTIVAKHIAKWNGTSWSPLASGINVNTQTKVRALSVFDDGAGGGAELFAAGYMLSLNGVPARYIAKWNGSDWSTLGGGFNKWVYALTAFDDGSGPALYAGGDFTGVGGAFTSRVAKWDGSSWAPVGGGLSLQVNDFAVFDDGAGGGPALYAGGAFLNSGGAPMARMARWDGSSWSALGSGMNGEVNALAVFDDGSGAALYAGGFFVNAGGVPVNYVAKWDGATWSALAGGMDRTVYCLGVFDEGTGAALYAGGNFTLAGGVSANRIAKWNGASWSSLDGAGGGMNNPVLDLAVFDDGSGSGPALYCAGNFTLAGTVVANFLARWDGKSFSTVGGGMAGGPVSALEIFDDLSGAGPALYAGGGFNGTGGAPAAKVAKWDGVSWSALGPQGSGMNFDVRSLGVFDDGGGSALYVGGSFSKSTAGDSHLAKFGCPAPPAFTTFCTAKTELVCGPAHINATGLPSATAINGFTVEAQPVRGCRAGLLLYSNQSTSAGVPFGGPGDGVLCLFAMGLRRAGPIQSGSSPQLCDATLAIDMNEFNTNNWAASGCFPPPGQNNPAGFLGNMGTTVNAQMWGRDSIATGQVLSDGIRWSIGP